MQKNRLFVKIYLWFWLTTIILLLTVFTIDLMTQSAREREHLQHFVGHILLLQGQQAVDIFENEGVAPFNRFIRYMEKPTGFHIYIFENDGREITGNKVSPEISALITAAVKDKITDTVVSGEKNLVLKSINSSKMEKYLIVAEVLHRPLRLPPPLGHPGPPGPGPGPDGGMAFFFPRLIVILIVSGIICYLLARYLTAPIVKLSLATRRFAAGDFSIRVNPEMGKRKDEISDLAFDFDHMAERIESLLTSQRNLLRDISHELRSPLARLYVALELCRQRSDGESVKFLKRIEQEAEKLNELIEQILTLNRVESGTVEFKKEKIDLVYLIGKIAADADFEARSLNRTVKVLLSEKCIITGNGELIRRAVENIVRNAVLYTALGSTVEISLKTVRREDRSSAVITVRDHGPGVPENEIASIFQPFYRIDEGRARRTGGTGIGLAIADAAIRLHGGSIKAVNVPSGGLSVEITLPMD